MAAFSSRLQSISTPKKSAEVPTWLTRFQICVGIIVSVATVFISWQTYQLTLKTQETTAKLQEIEQQLAETKFGFERIRDIYDRTEKYLTSTAQDDSRGRVLVVLINSLPDNALRSELLAVVTQQAKLSTVAAKAATFTVKGRESSPHQPDGPSIPKPPSLPHISAKPGKGFSGNLAIAVDEEKYIATTIGDFQFTDNGGKVWKVPKGTTTTASAIPRMAWSLVGPPLTSDYTIPTVLLEYYVEQRKVPPNEVYQMFLEALLETGMTPAKAKVLHSAIVSFGPRWSVQP